jgi:hypothetical protein
MLISFWIDVPGADPSARRNFFKCASLTWNPGSAPFDLNMYIINVIADDESKIPSESASGTSIQKLINIDRRKLVEILVLILKK